MLQTGQNWDLFGYDVRQLLRQWRSAWREFLWGYDSPVKARLDEVLKVYSEQGEQYFHAGKRVGQLASSAEALCEAVLLPESLVLAKMLVMPVAVEGDLDLAMAIEVTANSPFPQSDTGAGWKLVSRDDTHIQIQLVIVSLSSTMSYLGQQYDCHDAQAREVWAEVGDSLIALSGFGEKKRHHRYNNRLARVAATIGYCVLVFVLILGAAAGSKYLELQQVQSLSSEIKEQAGAAIRMRNRILSANETIVAVNQMVSQLPSPHFEMARLSGLLGDDAYLVQFSMQGTKLAIRGVADDAAVVVQKLTDESAYARVTAPQAITNYLNTGKEQFFLNVELAGDGTAGEARQ